MRAPGTIIPLRPLDLIVSFGFRSLTTRTLNFGESLKPRPSKSPEPFNIPSSLSSTIIEYDPELNLFFGIIPIKESPSTFKENLDSAIIA